MPEFTRIIGGAGTGKTTKLMEVLNSLLVTGIDPTEIGFASFTKIAVQTAAGRASEKFGFDPELVTQRGWFRTLHAACYHILGMRQNAMLSDDKASKKWLEECFDMELGEVRVNNETGFTESLKESQGVLAKFLNWWAYTRNTMGDPYATFSQCGMDRFMPYATARKMMEHYERSKTMDGKRDFVDLPLAVAGIRIEDSGVEYMPPEGNIPQCRAWIIDEYQDTNPILHEVAKRLTSQPSVEKVFVSADPFQAIYSFGGGHPRFFLNGFRYDSDIKLQQSFRCSPPVMDFAESFLKPCTDYFDRGVRPRESAGSVTRVRLESMSQIGINRDSATWLIIARTNELASRMTNELNKLGIPWDTTAGGTYLGTKKRNIAQCILRLRNGESITPTQWTSIVTELPTKIDGESSLVRGIKTQALAGELSGIPNHITMANLDQCGAKPVLVSRLQSDAWPDLIEGLRRFENGRRAFGIESVLCPRVKVGTIHSCKGDEADNVVLNDALTPQCKNNLHSPETANEERRVWYVGASRARNHLYVGHYLRDRLFMG